MKKKSSVSYGLAKKVSTICLCMVVLIITGTNVFAVEKGKIAKTAQYTAIFRAIGAMDPDEKIKNGDVLAGKFVPPDTWRKLNTDFGDDFKSTRTKMDPMTTAAYCSINARTKHIDAVLSVALKDKVKQVVILGAGYDSRAYRFHTQAPSVKYFEVDLAATQADKKERVKQIFGKLPNWVRYVSIDFNTQKLADILKKAGYNRQQKTLFIWEGVTMYINEEGIDETLRSIANNSAPGNSIVFDYFLRPVTEKDYRYWGAKYFVEAIATLGEPVTFGLYEGTAEEFVGKRGLKLISDLGPEELTQKYLIRSNGKMDGRVLGFNRIAYAVVPDKAEKKMLISKVYSEVKPEPVPQTHKVAVPPDIQAFLDHFASDYLSQEPNKIVLNYSDNYVHDGVTKDKILYNWITEMQSPSLVAATSAKIILTNLEIEGDTAVYSGFIKTNNYLDLVDTTILRKENGQWKFYGNQKKADED